MLHLLARSDRARTVWRRESGVSHLDEAWAMRNPVVYTLIWVVIILAVFVPLSVRRYARSASR